ncbi:MAG: YfhO family protein [Flavobacteriaceae bacterium]|nr:YfhO family protein [Flavobacteriaceae bacterium]
MLLKKIRLPLSLLGVLCLLSVFFLPLFQGQELFQSDTQGWRGMVQEIRNFKENTGEHSYWTGNLFSGMPTINIDSGSNSNLFSFVEDLFSWLPNPVFVLFITFLGFFMLLRILGVKHWLAVLGGLAYVFSSYFFIITAVGHITKMHAIAYFAFVVAGMLLAYRGKYLKGGLLFAVSLSLHIWANHPQITFYLLLLVLLYGAFILWQTIQEKSWQNFIKASLVLVVGAILAVGTNAENLYKVYDYAKVSIRGEQILESENSKGGVDLQYATEWSYGKDETLTLLIPNLKGGGSNGKLLDKNTQTYKTLQQMQVQDAEQVLKSVPTYWGTQLFTEGGVYIGAFVFFLFFFGLLSLKGVEKWWLVTATVLAIFLAWGRNFMGLYEFFYNYVPLFNKFRTPSMILVLAEFTMPLLAFYGLSKALQNNDTKQIQKNLLWSAGGTISVCLFLWLLPSLVGDFTAVSDAQLPEPLRLALVQDRKTLLQSDALRSAVFVLLGAVVLWGLFQKKISQNIAFILLGILLVADMWLIDRRFLSDENYIAKRKVEKFIPYPADLEILKDKGLSYRVLDITESPFNSSRASYFHKSIGGYHAAKMRRYQDVIEHSLQPEMQKLLEGLQQQKNMDSLMQNLPALRMLNLRYLLYNPNAKPLQTQAGLGNAWFVQKLQKVATPKEEIAYLSTCDVANEAVVLQDEMANLPMQKIAEGKITMTKYAPNRLEYESESTTGGIAVFSEIFHPDWTAKIDGKPIDIIRVNYTLMALNLPKGNHQIVLEFKPKKYEVVKWIGLIASILLLLLCGILIVRMFISKK